MSHRNDVTASPTPGGGMAVHGHAPGPEGTPTADSVYLSGRFGVRIEDIVA